MAKTKGDFYFIGFGNMAQAIYQRMDTRAYENIFLIEKNNQRIKEIKELTSYKKLSSKTKINNKLGKNKFSSFDTFLIAVKPAQIKSLCTQLKTLLKNNNDYIDKPLIISIAAGINSTKIKKYLNNYHSSNFVRAMPNLCAKKGMAITGLFGDPYWFGKKGGTSTGKRVSKIFTSIGQILWVDQESDLDSITAISGSGPAYVYYIMNAMIDTAIGFGLERSDAQRLVTQTIIGAGETGKNIYNLKDEIIKVSSKGGTTEKAINVFKQKKLDVIIKQAIKAAHKRSKELSNK
tara:strand:+ start:359 stop:1231 length:873 start_codon:yes stop_codon:yes gene_type:complete